MKSAIRVFAAICTTWIVLANRGEVSMCLPLYHSRRMNYTDAIVYLKEHDIRKDDGTFYEFGEVSTVLI